MMSMNKPTYSAIITHSPTKPVIVFVSSRRQTRLTAQDLISLCALEDNPKRFLHMAEDDLENLVAGVKDPALKLALQFGIGLHHAGLFFQFLFSLFSILFNFFFKVLLKRIEN